MSCEAWKWLAIVTGAVAIAGEEFYTWWVLGFLFPDPDRIERWHMRLRPYLPLWLLSGVVSLVSVIVYLAHCVD